MRKTGIFTAVFGAVLALALLLVRQGDWYARELTKAMSERVELVESAFRAGLILLVFGLALIVLSLRRPKEEPAAPAPLVHTWICPACGCENSDGVELCRVCSTPRYRVPEHWVCPACGSDNPAEDELCPVCGHARSGRRRCWVCPWCGDAVDESESFCPGCGARRQRS